MSETRNELDGLSIVNVVGTGSIDIELDLAKVESDIGAEYTDYDPEIYNGLYVRFEPGEPLITLYRTGKFIVSGASSIDELHDTQNRFLRALADLGITNRDTDTGFSVTNIVSVGDLGKPLDLNLLAVELGIEATEYEPEQFPGLVYRPSDLDAVILCFNSGKVVVPGATSIEVAVDAFNHIEDIVNKALD